MLEGWLHLGRGKFHDFEQLQPVSITRHLLTLQPRQQQKSFFSSSPLCLLLISLRSAVCFSKYGSQVLIVADCWVNSKWIPRGSHGFLIIAACKCHCFNSRLNYFISFNIALLAACSIGRVAACVVDLWPHLGLLAANQYL